MKLEFRYAKSGPLAQFVWGRAVEGYAPVRQTPMITLGSTDRLRWFDGIGYVCDHWDGTSGWKAPGYLGAYYNDAGALTYTPQP